METNPLVGESLSKTTTPPQTPSQGFDGDAPRQAAVPDADAAGCKAVFARVPGQPCAPWAALRSLGSPVLGEGL